MKKLPFLLTVVVMISCMLYASKNTACFARFVPERDDDFAWENDKVAFRVYGPALRHKGVNSGIDCWLKRVDYPIINKWYAGHLEGISYHEDHGEGYDPYHVGLSRGCGGLGLWVDGQLVHSETFSTWKLIHTCDEVVSFLLTYEFEYKGDDWVEEKTITLHKGDQLFKAKTRFFRNGKIAIGFPIAVGLTTHDGAAVSSGDTVNGWITCWETIDGWGLGTAVKMDPNRVTDIVTVKSELKDKSHQLLITKTDQNGYVEYLSGYGWERAGDFKTAQAWIDYVAGL